MGLGGTTKKLQKVVNMAEELYERLNYLREQLADLSKRVDQTGTEVERLQREQAANRALLEQLAKQQGIDVEEVLENVSTDEPNRRPDSSPGQGQGQRGQDQRRDPERGQDQQRRQEQGRGQNQGQRRGQGSS
jgi:vacuolar-type H+-ATPase subunit I/STV1